MTSNEFKNRVLPLSQRIYPMAARMLGNDDEARDAVQEVMIKLWDRRQQLGQHPNVIGFVLLTARNYCLDRLKKKKREQSDDLYRKEISDTDSGQGHYEQKELFLIVQKIIARLPEKQKEVIQMRDIDGFEFDEITAVTGLEVTHIRVLLSRARKHVRVQLEKTYSYEQGTNR